MFNNDLVGKDKPWGKYDDLLPWQLVVYDRYHAMVTRCENVNSKDYKYYGAKGIKCKFKSLSQYYNCLRSQSHVSNAWVDAKGNSHDYYSWGEFKRNPSLYHIDKDINGANEYSPSTIRIVLRGSNICERNSRVNKTLVWTDERKAKVSKALSRSVVGLYNGSYYEWGNCPEAAEFTGGSTATIQQSCNGYQMCKGVKVSIPHTKVKGKLKGWSFYWLDEYHLYSNVTNTN